MARVAFLQAENKINIRARHAMTWLRRWRKLQLLPWEELRHLTTIHASDRLWQGQGRRRHPVRFRDQRNPAM
jgi:hypothetical protein